MKVADKWMELGRSLVGESTQALKDKAACSLMYVHPILECLMGHLKYTWKQASGGGRHKGGRTVKWKYQERKVKQMGREWEIRGQQKT